MIDDFTTKNRYFYSHVADRPYRCCLFATEKLVSEPGPLIHENQTYVIPARPEAFYDFGDRVIIVLSTVSTDRSGNIISINPNIPDYDRNIWCFNKDGTLRWIIENPMRPECTAEMPEKLQGFKGRRSHWGLIGYDPTLQCYRANLFIYFPELDVFKNADYEFSFDLDTGKVMKYLYVIK